MSKVLVKIVGLRHIGIREKIGLGGAVALRFHRDRGGRRLKIIINKRALRLESGAPLRLESGLFLLRE